MTRYYHQRFFSDVRFTAVGVISLLALGFGAVPEAFLLVPVVALLGANQTAFDASYLDFARHYAARLEDEINAIVRRQVLVGAAMEDRYLYPLGRSRIVGVGWGAGFSWFGWMTILYTILGALAYAAGLVLGWQTLEAAGSGWTLFYLGSLGLLTFGSISVGWWWFVAGAGRRRLVGVLDSNFARPRDEATIGNPAS